MVRMTFGTPLAHSIHSAISLWGEGDLGTDVGLRRLVPVAILQARRVADIHRGSIHDARHRIDAKEHDSCACV